MTPKPPEQALSPLLREPKPSGRYRIADEADDVARRLADHGWRVARLRGTATKREFLARAGEALDFPGYYGANYDAFADCLGDLTDPTALLWDGWQGLVTGDPDAWRVLGEIFDQRYADSPPFALVLLT